MKRDEKDEKSEVDAENDGGIDPSLDIGPEDLSAALGKAVKSFQQASKDMHELLRVAQILDKTVSQWYSCLCPVCKRNSILNGRNGKK